MKVPYTWLSGLTALFGGILPFLPHGRAKVAFPAWLIASTGCAPRLFLLEWAMPNEHPSTVTEQQWLEAVEAFELGYRNGSQIARDLGVSAATVSREFKRRGARKACRVAETVVELEASLDAKARRRARQRAAEETAALERLAVLDALIADMVKTLIVADRAGDLASARPKVNEIGRALGVKGVR